MISLLCEAVCTKGKDIMWLIRDKMARQDLMAVKAQQPEQPGGVSPGQKGTSFARTKIRICFGFFFKLMILNPCRLNSTQVTFVTEWLRFFFNFSKTAQSPYSQNNHIFCEPSSYDTDSIILKDNLVIYIIYCFMHAGNLFFGAFKEI